MNTIARLIGSAGLAAATLTPNAAYSQAYPSKPVRVIVAAAAGGGIDLVMRLMSAKLSEGLGQPVIVDNRAGANGVIAAEAVSKSPPDGYTLLFISPGAMVSMVSKPPYDPVKDFTPITIAVVPASPLLVAENVPVSSFSELIAYARSNPGKLSFGSTGIGSVPHLTMEALKRSAKLDILHIPYKGVAPAITDLTSGQISMVIAPLGVARPLLQAGKIKALAVSNAERCPCLPGVPSIFEVLPRTEIPDAWFGIFGPAPMAQPLVSRLYTDIAAALRSPEIKGKLEGNGLLVVANTPDQFAAQVRSETELFARAVKEFGLKAE
jgi:tripartite-type tricarboxylate transporter receptor subunit TctC